MQSVIRARIKNIFSSIKNKMGQNLTTIPQHKYHATALDDILYRKEENRLESFKRWKNSNGDPKQLEVPNYTLLV